MLLPMLPSATELLAQLQGQMNQQLVQIGPDGHSAEEAEQPQLL